MLSHNNLAASRRHPARAVLSLAVAAAFSAAPSAMARTLNNEDLSIDASTPVDNYHIGWISTLQATGATTREINVGPSGVLTMTGSTATSASDAAVNVSGGRASIVNSKIVSTGWAGLVAGSTNVPAGNDAGRHTTPVVTVVGSEISGTYAGATLSGSIGATLTLQNSTVTGTDATGTGVWVLGGTLISQGTTMTGGENGLRIRTDKIPSDPLTTFIESNITLDNSTKVVGGTGSGILVENAAIASINVLNGSTVTGGNGKLLEVVGASTVNFSASNTTLNGDIVVEEGSTTTAALGNNASLSGNLIGISSLTTDRSAITGNLIGNAAGTTTAALNNGSIFNGNATGIASLAVDGSAFTGNVVGKADGTTSVLLSNNAVLEGELSNVGSLGVNSGAAWNMTGSGSVVNLAMNAGSVALSDQSGRQFNTLTVQNLSGNGSFLMGADLSAQKGDLLVVTNNATGNHQLNVKNSGANPRSDATLKLVETAGGDANFNVVGGAVDVGTYKYLLDRQGNDWYLVGTTEITASAATVIGLHSTAPTVWYGEAASLRTRMGDLRLGNVEAGAWARTYGRGYRVGADAGQAYDQKQTGVSVGMDRRIPVANGQLLVGGFGGYSKSDLDFDIGTSGKVDSYYLGAYATWMREDGYYLDGLIKFNRFKNTAAAVMSDGVQASGDYRSYGWGGQIEAGRYIALAESNWFVEPYVQLSAVRAGGKDYWLSNGMHAENADMNSFVGRIGTSVGLNYKTATGNAIRPYMKIAVAHEFAKNNKVFVNGDQFNNDLSGTRVEVGFGIAAQLTPALQLHGDLDYASGKNFKQKWGANLGLRYAF